MLSSIKRRRWFAVLATIGLSVPALAQAPVAAPAATPTARPAPRLVVAIAIDQFSSDTFAEYRRRFTGGLARLEQGVVFPAGYQSHAATETCPGHSTILTGARPARNGIVANSWFDLSLSRADKKVYCAEDETKVSADPKATVTSPVHLLVPTLGERLKAADPRSRNIAVAGKDRAALMMGGTNTDAVYFWSGTAFRTLDGRTAGPELAAVNDTIAKRLTRPLAPYPIPAACAARARPIVAGDQTVGAGRLGVAAGNLTGIRYSPLLDAMTLDLAKRLVVSQGLGQGAAPDVLAVSLSGTDYIGHGFGTEGLEMCINHAELDKALADFFAFLDTRKVDYMVVLTADHGGFDLPERLDEQALPQAARADVALAPGALGKAIGERLGLTSDGPLLYADGPFGDFYVNRGLELPQKTRVLAELKKLAETHPQVAAVFLADEIKAHPMPAGPPDEWSLLDRVRAAYYAGRSGDAVILLDKAVVPISKPGPGYVATHGSPWDYDRRVPILFWRKGMAGFEQPAPVEVVDIAPTLAAVLRLPAEEGAFDGRCLDLDAGQGNSCAP